MKQDNVLNVLYQSDSNTQYYLGVSIASLLQNNVEIDTINIYLIDIGIGKDFLLTLTEYVSGYGRKLIVADGKKLADSDSLKDFPQYAGTRKNKRSYLKMFWDSIISADMERLVYIDCDTVINGSLGGLMTMDMQGGMLGMVCDALITDEIRYVGLDADDRYYNSGVIVFDVKKWKDRKGAQRVISHSIQHTAYGTVDQDLINVEFKNDIFCLPLMYNYQSIHLLVGAQGYCREFRRSNYYDAKEIAFADENAKIIHFLKFVGQTPWEKGSVHPCREIFEAYLDTTPWKNLEKKESHPGFIFKIEKVLYYMLPRKIFIYIYHKAHRMMIIKSNRHKENKER